MANMYQPYYLSTPYQAYPQYLYTTNQPNYNQPTMPMPTQQAQIRGRLVSNPDEITPAEVLMDGQVYFFPKNDFSCIYAKTWDKDGKLQTFRFVPEAKVENNSEPQVTLNDLNSRLDKIEKMLEHKTKPWNNQKSNNQNAKGDQA